MREVQKTQSWRYSIFLLMTEQDDRNRTIQFLKIRQLSMKKD
jgi:hypothetical protein